MRLAVSLIVVSQKRPKELERLLNALVYQTVENFEIIVVSDVFVMLPPLLTQKVNYIEFHEMNIARARNVGIRKAKAPIIAFCDDDATPDPRWLELLTAPFFASDIGATTGFVRGRNGISYQWQAIGFNSLGQDHKLNIAPQTELQVFFPEKMEADSYIKTIGTNCAFRRDVLHKIGGFDEGFFYYLDDADVNLRAQKAGFATAIVPKAEIIHSYYESRGRTQNRVPKTLYNIGASTHFFLLRHHNGDNSKVLENFQNHQHTRLQSFFHFGLIRGRQIDALMRDLSRGITAGAQRESLTPLQPIRKPVLAPLVVHKINPVIGFNKITSMAKDTPPLEIEIENTVRAASMQFIDGRWVIRSGRFGRFHRNEAWWSYRTRQKAQDRILDFIHARFG